MGNIAIKEFLNNSPIYWDHLSKKSGVSYGLIRGYACGSKTVGAKNAKKLNDAIQKIAKDLSKTKLI